MPVPLTRGCPQCQEEMDLITADDVGEVLVYECPECGYQEETRVEPDEPEDDDPRFPDPLAAYPETDDPEDASPDDPS